MDQQNELNYSFTWFVIATLAAAIPIPMIKQYTETLQVQWLIFSMISYTILLMAYVKVLKGNYISLMYPVLKVSSALMVVFIGIIFDGEILRMKNIVGIFLACISLYLLNT